MVTNEHHALSRIFLKKSWCRDSPARPPPLSRDLSRLNQKSNNARVLIWYVMAPSTHIKNVIIIIIIMICQLCERSCGKIVASAVVPSSSVGVVVVGWCWVVGMSWHVPNTTMHSDRFGIIATWCVHSRYHFDTNPIRSMHAMDIVRRISVRVIRDCTTIASDPGLPVRHLAEVRGYDTTSFGVAN